MNFISLIIISILGIICLGVIFYLSVYFRLVFSSILFMVLIVLIRSGIFIVNEGSQAVITQFGAVVGKAYTEAGLYFKVPFLWKVNYFDKRLFRESSFEVAIPTSDGYFITLDEVFNWRISDASIFIQTMENVDAARTFIRNNVSGGFRQAVARNKMIDIVRSNDRGIPDTSYLDLEELEMNSYETAPGHQLKNVYKLTVGRAKLNSQIRDEISKYTQEFGIEIVGVLIRNVSYELNVEERIHLRMIMERLREAARLNSLGRSEAQRIKGLTNLKYQEIIAPAQRNALLIKGKAEAEAARIQALAFDKDKNFYSFWRSISAYVDAIPNMSQGIILSTDNPFLQWIRKGESQESPIPPLKASLKEEDLTEDRKEGSK